MTSKKLLYNLNLTDNLITLGNLNSNNITTTNISTSSLSISGNVSFNSITIPNAVFTNVSSGSITATSSTISNSVFTNISTSSLLALGNTNTIGSIITTGGNVGINTINPTSRLDVNGTINANTYTGGSISISGILNSNTISSNVISASTITGGNLYLSNNVFIGGTLTTVNITTTNLVDVTISSGSVYANNITSTNIVGTTISSGTILGTTLNVSGNVTMASNVIIGGPAFKIPTGNIAARPSIPESGYVRYNSETQQFEGYGPGNAWGSLGGVIDIAQTTKVLASATPSTTDGNLYFLTVNSERMRINSAGNIGIGTSTPATTLDVSGTFRATTSVTSGALYATNLTSTNIVGTTISSGTILGTTLVSSANVSASLITTGTLNAGTLISSSNVSASIVTAGTLVGTTISGTNSTITNIVGTAVSTGTLNATTSINSADVNATNVTATNIVGTTISAGTILGTTLISSANVSASIVTAGTLVGSTISGTNGTITNIVGTTISAGTILGTTLVSSANVSASLITVGNIRATTVASTIIAGTTITGGSIYASGDLFVGGTITTVNITSTNLVETNVSAGVVLASTLLSAPGNSNTLGSIITTGGNVGIGSVSPTTKLQVNGGISAITSSTITNQGIHLQWNRSNAEGESWIINQKGGGTANSGIRFGRADTSNNVTELMRILDSGNVGIATNSPAYTFDVSGTARFTNTSATCMGTLIIAGPGSTTSLPATTTIGQLMSLYGPGGANVISNIDLSTFIPSAAAMNLPGVRFSMQDLGANNSSFNILTKNSGNTGTMASRIFIDGSGNVGINTSSPGTTLDVSGTFRATTSVTSGALYAANVTATNIVGTTISTGTLLASTINGTNSTITNAVHTALSTGTLEASGSISQYGAAANNYNGYLKTNNSGQASTTLLNPGIILFNQSGTYNYGMDMGSTAGGRFRTRIFAPDTADIAFSFAPAAGATSQSGFTDRVVISGSGNMGIGTVTPLAELNVQGDASGTYASDSGQIIISGSTNSNKRLGIALDTNNNVGILQAGLSGTTTYPIALNPGGSNVGINTTSPGTTLDVSGTFRATTSVTSAALFATNVTATNIVSTIISSGNIRATTAISTGTLVASTLVSTANLAASNITVGTSLSALGSSNTLGSIITIGGGVGIGTSSLDLGAKLQISGGSVVTNMNNVGVEIGGTGTVGYLTTNTNHPLSFAAFGPTAMTIYTSGNIGINNLSARSKLEISPSAVDYHSTKLINDYALSLTYPLSTMGTLGIAFGITSVTAPNTTLTPGAAILFERLNSSTLSGALHFCTKAGTGANNSPNLIRMTIQTSGNIGIGTTSPSAKLELSDSTGSSNAPFIKLSGAGGAGNQVGIKLNPWSGRPGGDSSQIIAVDDGAASSHLTFYTAAGGDGSSTSAERMRITANGYVGIGTNNPGTPLEVVGQNGGFRHTYTGCSLDTYNDGNSGWLQTYTNHPLHFTVNNGSPQMTVNTNGNIGIGTQTPSVLTKLQVLGKVGIGETDTTNNGRGTLDIKPTAIDYHSTKLMADYALTLSYNAATNGSLGIGFGVSATGSITPGASIIFERTASTNVGLLHFCTKSGTAATAANLIRMTVQTSGNVGIGTTAPTSTLQINGSLAKTSGTFDIKHPIVPDKRLVHSFIEGPRCDLIYRGKVTLQNGQATVNLDTDCVQEQGSAMTQGTFEALCANPDYYLQNNSSFDRVKGSISGNILTIICENSSSTDKISWMIVAERKDEGIKEWDRTNSSGYLITEYSS